MARDTLHSCVVRVEKGIAASYHLAVGDFNETRALGPNVDPPLNSTQTFNFTLAVPTFPQ